MAHPQTRGTDDATTIAATIGVSAAIARAGSGKDRWLQHVLAKGACSHAVPILLKTVLLLAIVTRCCVLEDQTSLVHRRCQCRPGGH